MEVIMWNGLLPIGSVVMLKGGDMPVMIIGCLQARESEKDNPTKIYDYVGVGYPIGLTAPDEMIQFDHDAIETIYNVGYINDDMLEFLEDAGDTLSRLRDGSLTIAQLMEEENTAEGDV